MREDAAPFDGPSRPRPFDAVLADIERAGLRLNRSWPRSPEHLLLELADPAGHPEARQHAHPGEISDIYPEGAPGVAAGEDGAGTTAAQWIADPDRAGRVTAGTPGAWRVGRLVGQPAGADRKLPALAGLLAREGHQLVAHRPERRAVVRGPEDYIKVVRPDRLETLVSCTRAAAELPIRTPRVRRIDAPEAAIEISTLPGVRLHDLLEGDRATQACRETGRMLARLHRLPVPDGAVEHGPDAELAVLRRWQDHARVWGLSGEPDVGGGDAADESVAASASPSVSPSVSLPPPDRWCLLHRDLHDKQVLLDDDGTAGLLDFDLLAVGDPALDLANLLVHLWLRARQGLLVDPEPLQQAVLDGYRPTAAVRSRLDGYAQVARLRLGAVYAFRSGTRQPVRLA